MGIEGIEVLTNSSCDEWWKDPRTEASGEPIVDHNHVCSLTLNHQIPCKCKCGAERPLEDHD